MIITVDKVNKTYKNGTLELQVLKNISMKVCLLTMNTKKKSFLL